MKRLLIGILVILCVSIIIFLIMQAMPGDPVDLMTDVRTSAAKIAELKEKWGLDKPVIVQIFIGFPTSSAETSEPQFPPSSLSPIW